MGRLPHAGLSFCGVAGVISKRRDTVMMIRLDVQVGIAV